MLQLIFLPQVIFNFLCFDFISIHYHAQIQKKNKNYLRQKININTQNVKIARTDRYYSNEENSFRDLTLKTLNIDFYQYKINVYTLTSGQDTVWYSFCSAQEKCVSLAQPYTTESKFSLRVFLLNLLSVLKISKLRESNNKLHFPWLLGISF